MQLVKTVIEETTNDRGFCEMTINDETNKLSVLI